MNHLFARLLLAAAAGAALLAASPSGAAAQFHVGPQISAGTDGGAGAGLRLVFPPRLGFMSIDGVIDGNYFFRGDDDLGRRFEANANGRFPLPVSESFVVRAGGGLNFTVISLDGPEGESNATETGFGANLLGAVEFSRNRVLEGRAVPFVELRLGLGTYRQAVIAAGLTFGPPRS